MILQRRNYDTIKEVIEKIQIIIFRPIELLKTDKEKLEIF